MALLEERAEFNDLEQSLFAYTNGFTKSDGSYPLQTRSERESAYEILLQHYKHVTKNDLDYDRPSTDGTDYVVSFSGPLDDLEEDLIFYPDKSPGNMNHFMEDIEKHDELNPKLFKDNEIIPEVKDKLLDIAQKFEDNLKSNGLAFEVRDVVVIGSNVSYNYNRDSDIDLHLVCDMSPYENEEDLALKCYNAYRSLWNNKYEPLIKGIEVEIYVEPDSIHANSNGMYSLLNGWLKVPTQSKIPDIDQDEVDYLLDDYIDRFNEVETIDDIDQLIDDIYLERQQGILNDGEYALSNLVFKEFRARGYLSKLKRMKVELENEEMSLED